MVFRGFITEERISFGFKKVVTHVVKKIVSGSNAIIRGRYRVLPKKGKKEKKKTTSERSATVCRVFLKLRLLGNFPSFFILVISC